jgi:hypothetical protein
MSAILRQHTKRTTSQPTTSQHRVVEPSDDPDDASDDDGILANSEPQNEHVGVDDGDLYLPTPNTHVGGDHVGEQSESDSKSDFESDVEYEEGIG